MRNKDFIQLMNTHIKVLEERYNEVSEMGLPSFEKQAALAQVQEDIEHYQDMINRHTEATDKEE